MHFAFVFSSFFAMACLATSIYADSPVSEDVNVGSASLKKEKKCFPITGELSLGFDDFRSMPEGSWEGNRGAMTGLNLKGELPGDFFVQLGSSYGIYDWEGRLSTPALPVENTRAVQQQIFVTEAFYRASTTPSRFHAGVAYDWMFNRKFGLFALNLTLEQARIQLGYLFHGGNEFGVWGTVDTKTVRQEQNHVLLKFRSISQANLFWCHYFKNRSYAMLWGGMPYRKGLMYESGPPGRYMFGARCEAPLTGSLSISGHASYMGPRASQGAHGSRLYAANVCFALNYAFGQCRKAPTPYMMIADNSLFIVDTNYND